MLLIGHGSQTCNNPHAVGLVCGACGGQTGEMNARVLAQLLKDREIRDALSKDGIEIPIDTRFLPRLHITATLLKQGMILIALRIGLKLVHFCTDIVVHF